MVPTGWQVVALLDDCWPQRNGTSVASDYNFTAQAIQFPGANSGERITVFFYLSVPFMAGERGNKDREINEKADRLKELTAELVAEARSRESELAATDGGGMRWTAEGGDGCVARVNFPAPTHKAKIDEEGKVIEMIKELASGVFTRLFVPTISYRPAERFREEAAALLPKADANRLINLCQSASAPRVSFETTERVAA